MAAIVQILIGAVLQGALYTLGAIGLSLSFGVLRIMNLSHGDFLMLGGFAGYFAFVYLGLNPFVAAVIVGAAHVPAGIAYHEVLLARLAGTAARRLLVASVMVTLGTALAIEDMTSFLWGGASVGVPYRLPSLSLGRGGVPGAAPRAAGVATLFLTAASLLLPDPHLPGPGRGGLDPKP